MKQFLLIIGLVLLSSCTKPDNNSPKEDDENNNTEAFTIETSQISGLSAVIDIKPQDKNTKYFYWLYEMDRYINEFQESDELIIENDIAYWQYVEECVVCTEVKMEIYYRNPQFMICHNHVPDNALKGY